MLNHNQSIEQFGNAVFSADVKLHLYVAGTQYELGHLGPDFAFLAELQSLDASEGEIETVVGNIVTRWPVRLTSPVTIDSLRFTFEPI
ncbi:MAG: hypothetical protein KDB22_27545 [Planctomycetales bacterium]|nr:hypothetical protein [Planctomycetales bacterium]